MSTSELWVLRDILALGGLRNQYEGYPESVQHSLWGDINALLGVGCLEWVPTYEGDVLHVTAAGCHAVNDARCGGAS